MKMRTVSANILILTAISFLPLTGLKAQNYECWPVTRVSCGDEHSLFTKSDGSLWGMGANGYGQLGLGQVTGDFTVPQQIVASGVGNISCGYAHSLFVQGSSLWAMGDGGLLGDGQTTNHYVPEVIYAGGFLRVRSIAAGYNHSLFVTANAAGTTGALRAMGANDYGQLGDGTRNFQLTPEVIFSTNNNAAPVLAAGYEISLFIRVDGSLWTMGEDYADELGI